MSKTEFRQVDLDALGYPKIDIRPWLDMGYATASIKQADGYGTRNVYSRDDVLRIIALKALVRVGFVVKLASKILDSHREYLDEKYMFVDFEGPSISTPEKRREHLEDVVAICVLGSIGLDDSLTLDMTAWAAGVREKSYDY